MSDGTPDEFKIPIFVMHEEGALYGALYDMTNGDATCVLQTFVTGDGESYGYPCNVELGMNAIEAIDALNDSCQLRDLLMVFFTAGFRAGREQIVASIGQQLGVQ